MRMKTIISLFCFFLSHNLWAQNQAIGSWRAHLPYNLALGVASDGNKLFVACPSSFYTYDLIKDEISTYSKVNGMSDIELAYVAYDKSNDLAILAYNNSNIDLFKDETFYNIPDIKLKSIAGDKKINHIHVDQGLAYLSTGIGILVLNLNKKEIKETYVFTKNKISYAVKSVATDDTNLYAATDNGLYRISKNNPNKQSAAAWILIDSTRQYKHACPAGNHIYVATSDSVFAINNTSLQYVYRSDSTIIQHLDPLETGLSICTYNPYKKFGNTISINNLFVATDSFSSAHPMQTTQTLNGHIWVADIEWSLRSKEKTINPGGPIEIGSFDILAENGTVVVAHGAYDDRWNIKQNGSGISVLENEKWTSYNGGNFAPFAALHDAIRLARNPIDKTLYIASLTDGLFYLKNDKTAGNYREDVFEQHLIDPSTYRLSGVAFDQYNNLCITQIDAPHELMVKAASDGLWYKFALPGTRPRPWWENGAAGLVIDDYNQKWFFSPAGGGVLVYNDNGTIDNKNDDSYTQLLSGKGAGNLPDNLVQCIVNDKKGTIWIGTNNGIGIVNCPDRITQNTCEAEIRIVQYDQFAGQLFAGEIVKTIAVDGANRKWVGTSNGVWLISEDANKIIYRFTVGNSPLPSNIIQCIKVDPIKGDVYIGTDKGLVSFRSTATDGASNNKDALIFPNPIKSGYTGTIAISGLVDNADVRITDIAGQLIYRCKALGGQAVWNGLDYTGHRPQSGVFLVFASNNTGLETFVGKMVMIK